MQSDYEYACNRSFTYGPVQRTRSAFHVCISGSGWHCKFVKKEALLSAVNVKGSTGRRVFCAEHLNAGPAHTGCRGTWRLDPSSRCSVQSKLGHQSRIPASAKTGLDLPIWTTLLFAASGGIDPAGMT